MTEFDDYMEEDFETPVVDVQSTSRAITTISPEKQAIEIYRSMGTSKLIQFLKKRDEYVCADPIKIDKYLNKDIIVLGMWLNTVPAGEDKNGNHYDEFLTLLVKISDEDKEGKNFVIRFSGRQALLDAQNIWLPVWGWGDWSEPIKFTVTKSGYQVFLKIEE